MLKQFSEWFLRGVKAFFTALWQFIVDAVAFILDAILSVLVALLNAIPVPSFMQGGLQGVYGMLDPGIAWVLSSVGIPQALSIIGAAYVFRLARKAATLFQW